MKLRSISDHSDLLEETKILDKIDKWKLHRLRVAFGRQILNISFFVPAKFVDGEGVVLELPIFKGDSSSHWLDNQEYLLAKSNVLFEGFEIEQDSFNNDPKELYIKKDKIKFGWNYNNTNWNFYFKTIEDLLKYELTLTATAKKQIGL